MFLDSVMRVRTVRSGDFFQVRFANFGELGLR